MGTNTNTQVARIGVPGGDVSMKNYTVTDIPANIAVLLDATAGNINGVIPPATAGSVALMYGIAVEILHAGKTGRVQTLGTAIGIASGSIAVGDSLTVDSTLTKEGRVKTKTAGQQQIGKALDAVADGELVRVQMAMALDA